MAQRFCPECGGALHYEPAVKRYICRSCGLYVTREELMDLWDRLRERERAERAKRRDRSDYLEWWLSRKR
jgi:DNA-directed RNA polymerase subunit M/transcription elongation factor TFIIS